MEYYPSHGLLRPLPGGAYAAENATLTGAIELGEGVGIWFGSVLRGDDAPIVIGARTNIQDLCIVHPDPEVPMQIGEDVLVGHRCVLHGAAVGERSLIGMGAVLLGGSKIGAESIVAAGTVVRENQVIPSRSLVAGVPGKVLRSVTDEEVAVIVESAAEYVEKIHLYLEAQ